MTPFSLCARVQDQLPWFVGDDLDEGSAAAVRMHLRECPQCRAGASSLLQVRRALLSHAEAAARSIDDGQFAEWHAQILTAVVEDRGTVSRASSASAATARTLGRWGAAAAAGTLVTLGFLGSLPNAGLLSRTPITATTDVRPAPMMKPLGQDAWLLPASQAESSAPGMMGRLSLRTLEDENLPMDTWVPPVAPRRPRPTPR